MKNQLTQFAARSRVLLQRLVRLGVCFVSPRWRTVQEGPLTQHLIWRGQKVGEQRAEYWIEENRCGMRRVWVREDGYEYQIAESRLGDMPNAEAVATASTGHRKHKQ